MAKRPRRAGAQYNAVENMQVRSIDNLRQFEEFKTEILPKLRKMMKEGKQAEDIIAFAQTFAAARLVSDALTNEDAAQALKSVKEVLDRGMGKPKERQEVTHKLEKLRDEELDALLQSKLAEASEADDADTATEH